MIKVEKFVGRLRDSGIDFFCGVPDSLLKSFCAYVTDNAHSSCVARTLTHVITANEGGAVALASGHYLATGRPAVVYMQNSGQGNAVNPLASLADPEVYSIPMVLLIGWRGEPGVKDEPQHVKQGRITLGLMETLEIPSWIIPSGTEKGRGERKAAWEKVVAEAVRKAKKESRPVALIVRKGLFEPYELKTKQLNIAKAPRERTIERLLRKLPEKAVIVSTTGMISRELYETRLRRGEGHDRDFLTVGSMGHASMIALGIAKAQPNRPVICLDGDGASIMQMGNMAIVGQSGCANLTHIVLNNAAHDSVGGQPTVGGTIKLKAIAKACGYNRRGSPHFVEIKVAKGARGDLGRPKEPPQVNKRAFMRTLAESAD